MKKILYYIPMLCLLSASCSDLLQEESYIETGKDNYVHNAFRGQNGADGCL